MLGLYCTQYRQLLKLARRLREYGIDVYEADVRPPERYLMERFITAPVWFGGQPAADGAGLLLDGQIKPAPGYRPSLKLVSLDIETTAHGDLYCIALEGCGQRQVYMLGPPNGGDEPLDFDLEYCDSRPQMLEQLNGWMERHDPDAIIGWNVVQFDLRVLQHHAERYHVPLRLGRGGSAMEWREHGGRQGHFFAAAAGRLIIDGIEALQVGDLELFVVQPGERVADAARRGQVDRQPLPAHGGNQPPLRRGQAGAGALQPEGLRAGDADFRQDRAADLPAGARQRDRPGGRPQRRLGGRLRAPVHADDAPPGLRGAQPGRRRRRRQSRAAS